MDRDASHVMHYVPTPINGLRMSPCPGREPCAGGGRAPLDRNSKGRGNLGGRSAARVSVRRRETRPLGDVDGRYVPFVYDFGEATEAEDGAAPLWWRRLHGSLPRLG
jgi:hypothetical protein